MYVFTNKYDFFKRVDYYKVKQCYILLVTLLISLTAQAQSPFAVSGIVTDYRGLWISSTSAINATRPDNSHNLLAFTFNNITYSTGVADNKLTGITFTPGNYRAIGVGALTTPNNNTKIALGQLYDGVNGGASDPPPSRDMATYLTDGLHGLDIGTGVANLPVGTIQFNAKNIVSTAINDGRPDIVVTQIADPSTTTDTYRFYNAAGTQVGTSVSIVFSSTNSTTSIPAVGSWQADFYEAVTTNTPALQTTFTNGNRQIRLWAADFSSFGITQENYASVDNFRISLGGSSDLAFVAYNAMAFDIPLPISLTFFQGKIVNEHAQLSWQSSMEKQNKHFIIEVSTNAKQFVPIDSVTGAGSSTSLQDYSYIDKRRRNGITYYRLKQVDFNGKFSYSQTISVEFNALKDHMMVYPNPSLNKSVIISHKLGTGKDIIKVFDVNGRQLVQISVKEGSIETPLDTRTLKSGIYQIIWLSNEEKNTKRLVIQ